MGIKKNLDLVLTSGDVIKIRMINEELERVNIDFPSWMVQSLDREAKHIGVNRKASRVKLKIHKYITKHRDCEITKPQTVS